MFRILTFVAFLGATAIILGAFGAHALQETLTTEQLNSYKTAVSYQIYHVLLLLFICSSSFFTNAEKKRLSYIFILGILFFSGSIYGIQLTPISAKSIWFVTPLGGLLFIVGWLLMFYIFIKKSSLKK